ncbi:Wiskott-Aldrich syndrome protein family member 3 [Armadillidium vulgare]|nr:Wiskott-Aldrich syndrome protein family member 3 [Armadillidium vulgare]
MPLLKRVVWPGHVSRVPLVEEWVRDESGRVFSALMPATDAPQDLDAFTNLTLSNLITQLSSLSRHAEDLFGELIGESTAILNRTVSLQGRVDKLSVKVKNLDSNVEEVSLQDIHMRKAFKSSTQFDQQVVSRETIPVAMLEQYESCEQPPPLHELNPYRDDGKDGLKFYTDPSYFFNLWREEMKQETERLKHDKKQKPSKPKADGRSKKQKIRKAHLTRDKLKQKVLDSGEVLADKNNYRAPHSDVNQIIYDHTTIIDGRPLRPNSIEVRSHYAATGNFVSSDGGGIYSHNTQANHTYSPSADNSPLAAGNAHTYNQGYQDQYSAYPHGYTPDQVDQQIGSGTPTRNGMQRALSNRPSQPPPAPPSESNTPTPPSSLRGDTPTRVRGPSQGRENLPPPPPPPGPQEMAGISGEAARNSSSASQDLPPPPPTPEKIHVDLPPPTPPPPPPNQGPPPPPPPPLPNGNLPVAPPPPPMINGDIKQKTNYENKPRPVETDARSDLLKAIRDGIKLRKVEDQKPKPKDDHEIGDVASILQRRLVLEVSDSESSPDSDSDSDEWDETSA